MARKSLSEYEKNLSPRDILMSIKGVEVKDLDFKLPEMEGASSFEIIISRDEDGENKEWDEALAKKEMLDLFGDVALQAYGDHENPPTYDGKNSRSVKKAIEYTADAELAFAHKVLAVTDGRKVISFLALEEGRLENGENFGNISIGATVKEHRRQGLGTSLMTEVFRSNYDVVTGLSQSPKEVKISLESAQANGYTGFFCGDRNGVFYDTGSEEEQARVKVAYDQMTKDLVEGESTIDGEMPEGFVILDHGIDPIAPIARREIDQMPQGNLKDTFEKHLWPVQVKHKRDTVLGLFAALKNK